MRTNGMRQRRCRGRLLGIWHTVYKQCGVSRDWRVCDFNSSLRRRMRRWFIQWLVWLCGVSCTFASGQYCGDSIVNGVEACDLGAQNGQYNSSSSLAAGCSFDCTTLGGPRCGDDELQDGYEECDGGYEPWAGALCYNATNPSASSWDRCTSSCDNPAETCGGSASANACANRSFCVGGPNADLVCTTNANCPQRRVHRVWHATFARAGHRRASGTTGRR